MTNTEIANQLNLRNILFATDLSFAAERALPYALEIARRYGAAIYAVHAIQSDAFPMVPIEFWSKKEQEEEIFRKESKEDLEEQLHSVPHQIIFRSGRPWETLSGLIEEKHIDLMVFSTHGHSGLGKALFGSVAEEIFRHCPVPVLAVGPAVTAKLKRHGELNRILYATDFGVASLAAVRYVISLAHEHRAQLILVHSMEKGGDVPTMLYSLHQLVPFGADLRSEPDCVVEHGSPAAKILEVAESHGAELIILGVQGEKTFAEEHLMRSGVSRILAQSKCPVLIVRG